MKRDRRETKIAFTIYFDVYNRKNRQRFSEGIPGFSGMSQSNSADRAIGPGTDGALIPVLWIQAVDVWFG
jgi:hypothetical protein